MRIKRKWTSPQIYVEFNQDEVFIEFPKELFAEKCADKMPNFTWTFGEAKIKEQIKAIILDTILELQKETK